jgi:plasmid replication initiation protein
MIPTKENIAKWKEEKRQSKKKPKVHTKIANTFIENAIADSNVNALKTIYYLSTILEKVDMSKMQDDKIVGIRIDRREMLKYTEMSAPTLQKTAKEMQKTSITFIDEEDGIIEGMSLLPRYKFVPNKNIVELDLYVRIAKMIIDVKRNYTMMNIKEIMKLRKPHSVRMLALLNRISTYKTNDENEWEIPKRKRMTLDELNAFLGVNYKTWNKFEEKILRPVKEELDAHSTRSFIYESNYEALGRGRPSFKDVTIDVIDNAPRLF